MFYPDMNDEGYLPHKIQQLYVSGFDDLNLEVDITEEIDRKIQAILCHKTQIWDAAAAEKRWREWWGEAQPDGSVRYFERFKGMKFG